MSADAHEDHSYCTQSHIVDGAYINPWVNFQGFPKLMDVFKFLIMDKDNSAVPNAAELDRTLPVQALSPVVHEPVTKGVQFTWLGHATGLVQLDGISFLTDPIFSERCSPLSWIGPKRYRPMPCNVSELPVIDACCISHTHYDHMDLPTVRDLHRRFPAITWFVGIGARQVLVAGGIPADNVVELDWWQEHVFKKDGKDFRFIFTPCQHTCKRTAFDTNKSLWGSWTVIGPTQRFFFAGDTGYCEAFKQIGRRYGPFNLAAIPIGAYEPRWFMAPMHVNPEEAVYIHNDVRALSSVAVHWGTFKLAREFYLEPPQALREAMATQGILPSAFFTLKHGESRLVDNAATSST